MNNKYLCVLLFICLVISFSMTITACSVKKSNKILIKHESKYTKLIKRKQELTENIINLSDGTKINYDFQIGPSDVQSPSFDLIKIDEP